MLGPERLQPAPEVAGEQEVVIVEGILGQRHAQQQIERLDRGDMIPQPQEDVVRLVALAPAASLEERLLVRLDAARGDHLARAVRRQVVRPAFIGAADVQRREVQQAVGGGYRVVDVLVRECDVLKHGEESILAFQPADQVGNGMQTRERVQRAPVMARGEIG